MDRTWRADRGAAVRDRWIAMFALVVIAATVLPMFFDAYRAAYYRTVSFDDYSRFLLWVMGRAEGAVPPSPHAYRIGSAVMAVPFYPLPPIGFSGMGIDRGAPAMTPDHARALQAMCVANAFYATLAAGLSGLYLVRRWGVPAAWGLVAVLALLSMARYLGMASADGIAALPMTLTLIALLERRAGWFAVFVLLGTVVNEKVAMIAFLAAAGRAVFRVENRRAYLAMAAIAAAVLVAFALTVLTLKLPGLDNQRDPGTYLPALIAMTRTLSDAKGFYQNLWPVLVLVALWGAAVSGARGGGLVQACDLGVIAGLFAICLLLDVRYNVGRIMMFAAPLFVMGAVERLARRHVAAPTARPG